MNRLRKWPLTVSNAACRRVRPSLLIWAMPARSLAMAASTSLFSLSSALELLGQAGQVLVGLQVDAAEALAVGLEPGELAVGLLEPRRRRSAGQLGERQAAVGRAAQLIADAARLLGPARAGILEPGLGAGAGLALVGDGSLGGAQLLGGLAVGGVGGGQLVGGGLAASSRRSASSLMSFWRCCSIMAGSPASLAISASASAMRSFSVAICWSAPAERVCQRSRSSPMAACRSVRARCSRSSVMSSVRLSVTRARRSTAAVCAPARSASSVSVPRQRAARPPRSRRGGRAPRRGPPGAALGVGDGRDLGFRLARLALHGGEHLARLRHLGLRLAPELAQPVLLGVGRARSAPQPSRRRHARPRRRGAASASWRASAPSRLRSASRVAAAADTWAAATKPSQRHRSPSVETSRWPGLKVRCSRAPSAAATTPIWRRRRVSSGGAFDVRDQRLDAGRQGRVGFGRCIQSPVHRGLGGDRRIEVVAQRRGERHLVAGLRP